MTRDILIPGPAQAILAAALELSAESPLREMVQEIERLKKTAAESRRGGRGAAPAKAGRRSRDRATPTLKTSDTLDDDECAPQFPEDHTA